MARVFTIQEMAGHCGLSAYTLRYYERVGLIDPVERAANGHRRYSESDIAWVGFLNRLRDTGMPVRQMRLYAHLRAQGDRTSRKRRLLLEEHRASIQSKMAVLAECHELIQQKIDNYRRLEDALPKASPMKPARKAQDAPTPKPRARKTRVTTTDRITVRGKG